jgi:hypothetical protein
MPLNNVPNPGQNLLQTRDQINDNFSDIDTAFAVNHVDYNLSNQGKHNFVTMPIQAADPVTLANENAIYSKSVLGFVDMYYRNQNNGAVYNLTGSNIASVGATGNRSGYLNCGGFLIKFGYLTCPAGPGASSLIFPTVDAGAIAIPAFTNCVAVFAGSAANPIGVIIGCPGATSNTNFTVINSTTNTQEIWFLAFGN